MTTYTFRVWLKPNQTMGYAPFSRAWRDIKVDESHTLHEFHEAIFEAFDRWDDQEYEFITRDKQGLETRRFVPPDQYDGEPSWPAQDPDEIERFLEEVVPNASEGSKDRFRELRRHPPTEGNTAETTIEEIEPDTLGALHYEFDLDREWEHHIELREPGIDTLEGDPVVVNESGDAPDQYPEPDP